MAACIDNPVRPFVFQLRHNIELNNRNPDDWKAVISKIEPIVWNTLKTFPTPSAARTNLARVWNNIQNPQTATTEDCTTFCESYKDYTLFFAEDEILKYNSKPMEILQRYIALGIYTKAVLYLFYLYRTESEEEFQEPFLYVAKKIGCMPPNEIGNTLTPLLHDVSDEIELIIKFVSYFTIASKRTPGLNHTILTYLEWLDLKTQKQKDVFLPLIIHACRTEKNPDVVKAIAAKNTNDFAQQVTTRVLELCDDPNSNKVLSFADSLPLPQYKAIALIKAQEVYSNKGLFHLAELCIERLNFYPDSQEQCERMLVTTYGRKDKKRAQTYIDAVKDPTRRDRHRKEQIMIHVNYGEIAEALYHYRRLNECGFKEICEIVREAITQDSPELESAIEAAKKLKDEEQRGQIARLLFPFNLGTIVMALRLGNPLNNAQLYLNEVEDPIMRKMFLYNFFLALITSIDSETIIKGIALLDQLEGHQRRDDIIAGCIIVISTKDKALAMQLASTIGNDAVKNEAFFKIYQDNGDIVSAYPHAKALPPDKKAKLFIKYIPQLIVTGHLLQAEELLPHIKMNEAEWDRCVYSLAYAYLLKRDFEKASAYILKVKCPVAFLYLVRTKAQLMSKLSEKVAKKLKEQEDLYDQGVSQLNGLLKEVAPKIKRPDDFPLISQPKVIKTHLTDLIRRNIIPAADKPKYESIINQKLEPAYRSICHTLKDYYDRLSQRFAKGTPERATLESLVYPSMASVRELLKLNRLEDAQYVADAALTSDESAKCHRLIDHGKKTARFLDGIKFNSLDDLFALGSHIDPIKLKPLIYQILQRYKALSKDVYKIVQFCRQMKILDGEILEYAQKLFDSACLKAFGDNDYDKLIEYFKACPEMKALYLKYFHFFVFKCNHSLKLDAAKAKFLRFYQQQVDKHLYDFSKFNRNVLERLIHVN